MADFLVYHSERSGVAKVKIFELGNRCVHDLRAAHLNVSLHFIGDKKMKELNLVHRGKNKTTDVLSFPAQEGKMFQPAEDLGDIFISSTQIKRQARDFGVSYREELTRMIVHGLLHLSGYDHDTPSKAKKMFSRQEKIVKKYCL